MAGEFHANGVLCTMTVADVSKII